uniref:PB1 domain-containing protein n=1 Tax=Picea sitchensis TaxID=3332 RepID=A9NQ05_PICSI|nr:unknown [Picea sitchensis]
MERAVIKFVDSDGLTRRLLARKSEGPPAMSFQDLGKYMCRLFHLEESTALRIKYMKDGDEVVVEDELGWEETCFSLSNREVLSVDIEIELPVLPDTKKTLWQQITITKSPPSPQQITKSPPSPHPSFRFSR